MKKSFYTTLVVVIFLIILSGCAGRSAMRMDSDLTSLPIATVDAYNFPITPIKTPDIWKTYTSHLDMLKALELPDEVLKSISTQGLIETCINYPLYSNYIYYNPHIKGIEIVKENFNGFIELYKRAGFAQEYYIYYMKINIIKMAETEVFASTKIPFIDFLMADEKVINQLDSSERGLLMNRIIENFHIRHSVQRMSSEDIARAYLLGRLLISESPEFSAKVDHDVQAKMFFSTGMSTGTSPILGESGEECISILETVMDESGLLDQGIKTYE